MPLSSAGVQEMVFNTTHGWFEQFQLELLSEKLKTADIAAATKCLPALGVYLFLILVIQWQSLWLPIVYKYEGIASVTPRVTPL